MYVSFHHGMLLYKLYFFSETTNFTEEKWSIHSKLKEVKTIVSIMQIVSVNFQL